MFIYLFIGYLNTDNIYISDDDIEIIDNIPVIKIGYTDNNYDQRKEEAKNNMIIKNEYKTDGTQKMERLIHKILKSSEITSQFTLPIEKKAENSYYTEYYHNYNNIIITAIPFIINHIKNNSLYLNDKRLISSISLELDKHLKKINNIELCEEQPKFIK